MMVLPLNMTGMNQISDLINAGPLSDIYRFLDIKDWSSLSQACRDFHNVSVPFMRDFVRRKFETYQLYDRVVGGVVPDRLWLVRQEMTRFLTCQQHLYLASKFLKNKSSHFPNDYHLIGKLCLCLIHKKDGSGMVAHFFRDIVLHHVALDSYAYHGLLCLVLHKGSTEAMCVIKQLSTMSHEAGRIHEFCCNLRDNRKRRLS
jgi:hypothetical protein